MLRPLDKETLKDIGLHILNGMSEEESCILSDISYKELQLAKEKNEEIRQYIDKKFLEFKEAHLKEIQKNKSEKNSMWMLEKTRPEFGPKASKIPPTQVNIISTIIKEIQNNDNSNTLIVNRGNQSDKDDQGGEFRSSGIPIGGGIAILE